MITSAPIEGSQVVAAMTPPTSRAPFNRGQLIIRSSDGTLVRAQTYDSEGHVQGPALTPEDLRGLVGAGQATELRALIPAMSGASLWVLRHGLPRRDRALTDLQMSGVLVHPPLPGVDDAKLCVVDESQDKASTMLDRWRDEAMAGASVHAERGEWDLAMVDAEVAQAVGRGLDAEVIGLLSLAYERCDRTERANGLLIMAHRSRGEEFEAQVVRVRERLQGISTPGRAPRARPRADMQSALRERFPGPARALGQQRSCRLAVA